MKNNDGNGTPLPTKGVILYYRSDRCMGFIRTPDTNEEFYFETQDYQPEFGRGVWVSFELVPGKKEYEVTKLRLLEKDEDALK